jgi:hypothetical protein
VAQSTVRIAARAGVVAASLLVLGPMPAHASADKHGSDSHSKHDYPLPGSANETLSNWVNDALGVDKPKSSITPPTMNLSTGSSGVITTDSVEGLAVSDPSTALRTASVQQAAVQQLPIGNVIVAMPRAGSGFTSPPVAGFRAPRVTFGNGRTPGTRVPEAGPAPVFAREVTMVPDAPEDVPAAPAQPAAVEITIPPLPPPLPPVEKIMSAHSLIGEYGTANTGTVADPLAGLVGLILIPAVGAVLGFRQARTAQALGESARA